MCWRNSDRFFNFSLFLFFDFLYSPLHLLYLLLHYLLLLLLMLLIIIIILFFLLSFFTMYSHLFPGPLFDYLLLLLLLLLWLFLTFYIRFLANITIISGYFLITIFINRHACTTLSMHLFSITATSVITLLFFLIFLRYSLSIRGINYPTRFWNDYIRLFFHNLLLKFIFFFLILIYILFKILLSSQLIIFIIISLILFLFFQIFSKFLFFYLVFF